MIKMQKMRLAKYGMVLGLGAGVGLGMFFSTSSPVVSADEEPITTSLVENSIDADEKVAKADNMVKRGKYIDAMNLYQNVMDEFAHVLHRTSHPSGRYYRRKASYIEEKIVALGEQGLEAYQLQFDGVAKGILQDPATVRDMEKLTQVASRYYLTNYGDDASFILGCLMFDRGDFAGALRYFKRTEVHPSLSVDEQDLNRRLAATYAAYGLTEQYQAYAGKARLSVSELSMLDQIHAGANDRINTTSTDGWQMVMGDSSREQNMPELKGMPDKGTHIWPNIWQAPEDKPLDPPSLSSLNVNHRNVNQNNRLTRGDTYERWFEGGWIPSGEPAFVDDMMIYRTYDGIVAINTLTGERKWGRLDSDLRKYSALDGRYGINEPHRSIKQPMNYEERMFFRNALSREVAVIDDTVFYIAGQAPLLVQGMTYRRRWGNQSQQAIGNTLVALKVSSQGTLQQAIGSSGKTFKQRVRGRWKDVENPFQNAQFLSLPVETNGRLVFAVLEGGKDIYLYGVNKDAFIKTGDPKEWIAWKQHVCSTPDTTSIMSEPVRLLAKDQTVYVSTSRGVVASYDVLSGTLNWLTLYERVEATRNDRRFQNAMYPVYGQTWQRNRMALINNQVIVAPMDSDKLISLDASSGHERWSSNRNARTGRYTVHANVMVGTYDNFVVVAGYDGVKFYSTVDSKKYRVKTGQATWPIPVEPGQRMTGIPAIAGEYILMPLMDPDGTRKVMKARIIGGMRLTMIKPRYEGDDPLGNLFSDGQFLFSVGIDRVRALAELQSQLKMVSARIEAGKFKPGDLVYRGNLRYQGDNLQGALADYERAWDLMKGAEYDRARRSLERTLFELCMKMLASEKEMSDEQTLALLERANKYGKEEEDIARLEFTRGRIWGRMGRYDEVVNVMFPIMFNNQHQFATSESSDRVRQRMDMLAADVIIDTLALEREHVALLEERKGAQALLMQIDKRVEKMNQLEASSKQALNMAKSLAHLSRLLRGEPAMQQALISSVRLLHQRGRWEHAEMTLFQARRASKPQWAALGLALYAEMSEKQEFFHQAASLWAELGEKYPDITLELGEGPQLGSELSAAAMSRLQLEPNALQMLRYGPQGEKMRTGWERRSTDGAMYTLRIRGMQDSEFLMRHAVLFDFDANMPAVQLLRMSDGKVIRSKRTPRMTVAVGHYFGYTRFTGYYSGPTILPGGADRHMVMMASGTEAHGIGLVSGRLLWSNKEMLSIERRTQQNEDMRRLYLGGALDHEVRDGVYVLLSNDKENTPLLISYDLLSGKELWRFDLGSLKTSGVRVSGDNVFLFETDGSGVWVFNAMTGELYHGGKLELPDMQAGSSVSAPLPIGDLLVYQSRSEGVTAVNVKTGKVAWRVVDRKTRDRTFARVFRQLDDKSIYITHNNGQFRVVDIASGSTRFVANSKVTHVMDAAVAPDGQTIFARCGRADHRGQDELALIDYKTGKLKKHIKFDKQGPYDTFHAPTAYDMSNARRYIPWPISLRTAYHASEQRVQFYDLETGKKENVTLPGVKPGNIFDHMQMPIQIRDGAIIVSTTKSKVFGFVDMAREKND